MAIWSITTAAARLEYDTDIGVYPTSILIDTNHILQLWSGGDAQVLTVNTSTWEITTAAAEFTLSTGMQHNVGVMIDANHATVFHTGADSDGYADVLTINTSDWTITTASAPLEFDTENDANNHCIKIDTTHIMTFWQGESGQDGYTQIFAVNTSTWAVTTAGNRLEFDTQSMGSASSYKIDTNHVVAFWYGGGTPSGFAQVFTINTSSWAITTANDSLEFDTVSGKSNACYQIDSTHYINFWGGDGDDGFVQVFAVSTSSWAVTTAGARLDFDTGSGLYNRCLQIDTNHFLNTWQGQGFNADGFAQIFTVNTSTWAVTTAAARLEFDTQDRGRGSPILEIDSSHYVHSWEGVDDDGFIQTFAINVPIVVTDSTTMSDAKNIKVACVPTESITLAETTTTTAEDWTDESKNSTSWTNTSK